MSCRLSSNVWMPFVRCWAARMSSRSRRAWGVHRSPGHRWVGRYLSEQLAGLADRSHRRHCSPRQVAEAVEAAMAEMRRAHPRWGSRRIRLEMLRRPGPWASAELVVPAERIFLSWCADQDLEPLSARRADIERYVRWLQDVRRHQPSTVRYRTLVTLAIKA